MNRTTLKVVGRNVAPDIWYAGTERDNLVEEVLFDLPPERDGELLTLRMENGEHTEAIALGTSRTWAVTRTQSQYPGVWTAYLTTDDGTEDQHWSTNPFRIYITKGSEEDEKGFSEVSETECNKHRVFRVEIDSYAKRVNAGEITIDDVPVEWQEEIQRRVDERIAADGERDEADYMEALSILGVEVNANETN